MRVRPVSEVEAATVLEDSLQWVERANPGMTAVTQVDSRQRIVGVVVLAAVVVAVLLAPVGTAVVLTTIATFLYLLTLGHRVVLVSTALSGHRALEVSDEDALAVDDELLPIYTVLVPAYREPEVLADLVAAIDRLEYPADRLDVKLLLEADDDETVASARELTSTVDIEVLLVPPGEPRTKPRALNYGFAFARGEYVTIYDAEDHPEPLQLRRAVVGFARSPREVACLQARLSFYGASRNLLTRWFTAEYATWFGLFLPGLAATRSPIPLGGTSNHFDTEALRSVGCWDAHNVTEDCDLGIRLQRAGHRVAILASTTMEEPNVDAVNWVKQRSRWNKGYLQTWLVGMRDPAGMVRDLGWRGTGHFCLFVGCTPVLAVLNLWFWGLASLGWSHEQRWSRPCSPVPSTTWRCSRGEWGTCSSSTCPSSAYERSGDPSCSGRSCCPRSTGCSWPSRRSGRWCSSRRIRRGGRRPSTVSRSNATPRREATLPHDPRTSSVHLAWAAFHPDVERRPFRVHLRRPRSLLVTTTTPEAALDEDRPRQIRSAVTRGDRVFRGLSASAAAVSLFIIGATALFLSVKAVPAIDSSGIVSFFTDSVWNPTAGKFGVGGLLIGTVIIALVALVVAIPLALGLAVFVNEYAPSKVRRVLVSAIDLLAALPSLIFAMWGFFALQQPLVGIATWFNDHLDALPFFRLSEQGASLTRSSFITGVVVALMILPIITAVSRDVMAQCPRTQCEGALALGGSRWGMIREVLLPFGRAGIVGSVLLGFGRALGETMVVTIIIALQIEANPFVLEEGGGSIAALIATKFGEARELETSALIAAGLALFLVTLAVNLGARAIVRRTQIAT